MIQLDKEKRLMLLRWLKYGIDEDELDELKCIREKNMTDEEIEKALERIYLADYQFSICARLQRIGRCRILHQQNRN